MEFPPDIFLWIISAWRYFTLFVSAFFADFDHLISYCDDIDCFPGAINLFKVNNKQARANFCKLEQSFSQRCVHVFLMQKNSFY